ncbi:hypothetical protein CSOJ01_11496 [Colletotrichum sojae]|uniref:Uncharacterized protein n=1 Tax=Colletotrichum sojae TaxID=2175907 RepID=A0A8H6IY92_9PEZI|nr:hypothetical protein CSOJ01_11496 [Colletotrichum sojae]
MLEADPSVRSDGVVDGLEAAPVTVALPAVVDHNIRLLAVAGVREPRDLEVVEALVVSVEEGFQAVDDEEINLACTEYRSNQQRTGAEALLPPRGSGRRGAGPPRAGW